MIVTLLLFIIILGAIIFIHEGGHFLFAKLTGIYVHEFSLGMGPKLLSKQGKETLYSLRAIPIGGFCQLAGEEGEEEEGIPLERTLQGKKVWQKFLVMFFGAGFNFLSAMLVLFFIGLIWGSQDMTPVLNQIEEGSPAMEAGLSIGDKVLSINGHSVSTVDDISIYIALDNHKKATTFKVEKEDGNVVTYEVTPEKQVNEKDEVTYHYGIAMGGEARTGFLSAFRYMFEKTGSLLKQMFITFGNLFTGNLHLNQLSGPVGIFQVVGDQAKGGVANLLYLFACLSINVGFINLIPFPGFDGGHILFIIIEKIKGSPVKPELEAKIQAIGLFLLMILMIYVTFSDILKLF